MPRYGLLRFARNDGVRRFYLLPRPSRPPARRPRSSPLPTSNGRKRFGQLRGTVGSHRRLKRRSQHQRCDTVGGFEVCIVGGNRPQDPTLTAFADGKTHRFCGGLFVKYSDVQRSPDNRAEKNQRRAIRQRHSSWRGWWRHCSDENRGRPRWATRCGKYRAVPRCIQIGDRYGPQRISGLVKGWLRVRRQEVAREFDRGMCGPFPRSGDRNAEGEGQDSAATSLHCQYSSARVSQSLTSVLPERRLRANAGSSGLPACQTTEGH